MVRLRCSASDCLDNVCWKCEGIEEDPFSEDALQQRGPFEKVYMFCGKHVSGVESLQREYDSYLKTLENSGGNDENTAMTIMSLGQFCVHVQIQEAKAMARVFSTDRRHHSLFSIAFQPADGWCLFHSLSYALDIPIVDLIDHVKSRVHEYVATHDDALFNDKETFLELWENLAYHQQQDYDEEDDENDDSGIQQLWSCEDGDLLLPMIADLLENVQICVWRVVGDGGRLTWLPPCYPESMDNSTAFKVAHVLKSNPIMPHFDVLEPIEPSLSVHGFQVFRKAVAVDDATRAFFTSLPRLKGLFHPIFNNAEANSEANDLKRWQVNYDDLEGSSSSVMAAHLMDSLTSTLQGLFPSFKVAGAAL